MPTLISPSICTKLAIQLIAIHTTKNSHMKKIVLLLVLATFIASFAPKPIEWVAIGDSITYLNEHANETGNRVTKGYMTRVVEKLPQVHYINQGHNGWTSAGIADKIET